jgi:hypothetical protein
LDTTDVDGALIGDGAQTDGFVDGQTDTSFDAAYCQTNEQCLVERICAADGVCRTRLPQSSSCDRERMGYRHPAVINRY